MQMPDYEDFFDGYARAFERSLGERVDVAAIRGFFAEAFISAGLNGVAAGANDATFEEKLKAGYAFYKAIGTRSMKVDRVGVDTLYEDHDRVRVFYTAGYRKRDGSEESIAFDVLYLLQRRAGGPKIFGFIAGDEMALFREHGLVDQNGRPV